MFRRVVAVGILASLLNAGVARASQSSSYCCGPVTTHSRSFSIDVRNTDIFDVVALISTASGANLVLDGSVKHENVTLRLQNVTLDEALATIMNAYGLTAHRSGSIISMGPAAVMARRFGQADAVGGVADTSRAFTLGHASAQELRDQLLRALPDGTFVIADARLNRIVVQGSPSTIAAAANLIHQVDETTLVESGQRNAQFVPLRWISPHDAIAATRQTFDSGSNTRLIEDPRQNGVLVVGDGDSIALEELLLAKLDQPGWQVAFDVKVIDLTPTNDQTNLGFLLNGGGLAIGSSSGNLSNAGSGQVTTTGTQAPTAQPSVFNGHGVQINAALNLLVQRGEATLLATPRVTVGSGQDVDLVIGQTTPILAPVNAQSGTQNFTTVDSGTVVKLTVNQMSSDVATVKMHLEYSAIAGFVSTFPQIDKRSIDTTETLTDDESIVVAGLYQDFTTSTLTKLPFLGDVPVFGQVFRNRQRSGRRDEIAFIITPHIVRGSLLQAPTAPAGIPPTTIVYPTPASSAPPRPPVRAVFTRAPQ